MNWLIEKLQGSFPQDPQLHKLPGWDSQKKLSPGYDAAYRQPKADALQASVMVLISPVNRVPHLNFIKRASRYVDDKHKGQIGFAGGKIEDGETELQAVIREVEEEIGIKENSYEIIGKITPLYVFVSNFLVHPFIAYANEELDFTLDPSEVDDLIQWPITALQKGSLLKDIKTPKGTIKNSPYYPLGEETLWGATAMMTAEFLDMLEE